MNRVETYLIETVSGSYIRVPAAVRKRTCMVRLSSGVAVNLDATKGVMELYTEDLDGVYRLAGHISLQKEASSVRCTFTRIPETLGLPKERTETLAEAATAGKRTAAAASAMTSTANSSERIPIVGLA